MSELKPCPFCGIETPKYDHEHKKNCLYYLMDYASRKELKMPYSAYVEAYNTRPLESALQSALTTAQEESKRLREALEAIRTQFFADGDDEIIALKMQNIAQSALNGGKEI